MTSSSSGGIPRTVSFSEARGIGLIMSRFTEVEVPNLLVFVVRLGTGRLRIGDLSFQRPNGVRPLDFVSDRFGFEFENNQLAGSNIGLIENWKVKLPPIVMRQVRRISDRHARS